MRVCLPAVLMLLGCSPKTPADPVSALMAQIPDDLDAPLPVDPGVKQGVLDNGLTWFVEANGRPAQRAELRLAVKAGSILEDDDQLGLAHFVEHMAFNGTENFPGNSLVTYLESVGTSFGAHLNAYTSFDETVYMLQVPTDDAELLDTGLRVLADWAGGLLFDPDECEAERGVVLEEWRLREGLSRRVQDAVFPNAFHGSRYLDRLPIGTGESLRTFSCDAARRFYDDWYRPDLMAVMVVGEVDVDAVSARIQEVFGALENPEPPRERLIYKVPDHDDTLVTLFSDPELPRGSVEIMSKVDDVQRPEHRAYREHLIESLALAIVNERLGELAESRDAPFAFAFAGKQGLGFERSGFTLAAVPKEGQELAALEVIAREGARARTFGVREAELARAKASVLRDMDAYWDSRDSTASDTHVAELVRVFLTGEPMPGVAYEVAIARHWVPQVTAEEVSSWLATHWMQPRSQVFEVVMPSKEGLKVPTEAEVVAAVRAGGAKAEALDAEEAITAPLMSRLPKPGKASRVASDEDLGTTTWELSNGMTLVLKPTRFADDEIFLTAFDFGGTSVVPDDDFVAAATATSIADASGVGPHDAPTLRRLLAGRNASAGVYLGTYTQGFYGESSVRDVETMFQLIHLALTQPRFDADVFARDKERRREEVRAKAASPEARFSDAWANTLAQDNPRGMAWSEDRVDEMDLEASARIYRERFADLSGVTVVIGGSFDASEMVTLARRYLASLPGGAGGSAWKDVGLRPPEGVVERTLSYGDTPRSRLLLQFHGPFTSDWIYRNRLSGLEEVLSTRLREVLREDLGGTYGVSVRSGTSEIPESTYSLQISFACDPDRLEELEAAMWSVIEEVRTQPASDDMMASIREKNRRSREVRDLNNRFWVGALSSTLQRREDPRELLNYYARNDALSAGDVLGMAQKVLNRDRMVVFRQVPEAMIEAGD